MKRQRPETDAEIAYHLSNNLPRLLREFSRDFERRIWQQLADRGYPDIRQSHGQVFANLGMGAVRVSELAERAQVTQQAMGKMLKELEGLGYITRETDPADRRARDIRLTDAGIQLARECLEVVDEVQEYYAARVGARPLADLEAQLRETVRKLELEYLPESWTETR